MGRGAKPTFALQAFALRQLVPTGTARLGGGRLTWIGQVRPAPECADYVLRIDVRQRLVPTVRVLSPALKPNNDGLLPHVYGDGTLCVNEADEWHSTMLLAQTLLPWACEWLIFYELWLATNIWYGDGPDRLEPASQAMILHPYS